MGISDITPWVPLGAGYRRGLTKSQYWDMGFMINLSDKIEIKICHLTFGHENTDNLGRKR